MRARLAALVFALGALALGACAPDKPDTSRPTIAITAGTTSGSNIFESGDLFDADGPGNILKVEWATTVGSHGGPCTFNTANMTFSCDFVLPAGNWTVIYTVTDKAGWTGTDTNSYSI